MKHLLPLFLVVCLTTVQCKTPVSQYSVVNAHSHNDYEKDDPFYKAYRAGFGSIEADVFAVNNQLLVAHSKEHLNPQHTLKDMYIDPLAKQLMADPSRHLLLLIDVKEAYKTVLPLLAKELSPLYPYLSAPGVPNKIKVVISGERPSPGEYSTYPTFLYFDDDLHLAHNAEQWNRVGLVSLPFDKISLWKGTGEIDHTEKIKLEHIIDSVHSQGKQIRFWAAPDNEESHILQMKVKADYIGTDKIDLFAMFLQHPHK